MLSAFMPFIGEFLQEQKEINTKNKEKVQEALDLYWKACDFPRKTKKKMRRKAKFDYSFWKGIDKWYNESFNF